MRSLRRPAVTKRQNRNSRTMRSGMAGLGPHSIFWAFFFLFLIFVFSSPTLRLGWGSWPDRLALPSRDSRGGCLYMILSAGQLFLILIEFSRGRASHSQDESG